MRNEAAPNSRKWSAQARTTNWGGQEHELVVTGEVELPSTGHQAELREAVPQGISDDVLILELVVRQGGGAQVMTWRTVHFEKRPIDPEQYSQVEIRGDEDRLAMVDVERILS